MGDFSLLNIVESVILCENRIDDAKKLAQKLEIPWDNLNRIIEGSSRINPNHKYLLWLIQNLHDAGHIDDNNLENVVEILTYFDRNNKKFDKRDINQYKSFGELEKTVLKTSNQKRRDVPILPGTTVIYDDEKFVVLVPETHEASCKYGAGTTWCTANKEEYQYKNYKSKGELYYIISRTKPTSDVTYKMAVSFEFSSNNAFPPKPGIDNIYNAQDKRIDQKTLTKNSSAKVLTVIKEDFNKKFKIWWNKNKTRLKQEWDAKTEKEKKEREEQAERQAAERARAAARALERRNEREEKRERGEYDDYEVVHALRQYLIESGNWEAGDEEEVNRITSEITDLNEKIDEAEIAVGTVTPAMKRNPTQAMMVLDRLRLDLEELENELDGVKGYDIYELHDEGYENYGLKVFTNEYDGTEWMIGDDDEADKAAREYLENFIEEFKDQPGMGFTEGFIDSYIDGDKVADEFENDIDNMVRESPDSYIRDDPEELTEDAQQTIKDNNEKIENLNDKKAELDEQLAAMDDEDEQREAIQAEFDEVYQEISDLESENDDIENDNSNREYTEEQIKDAVDKRLDDIRDDPISELKAYGITDFREYIDEEKLIDDAISRYGRGHNLASYDGAENETTYNGTTYYIYRTN